MVLENHSKDDLNCGIKAVSGFKNKKLSNHHISEIHRFEIF